MARAIWLPGGGGADLDVVTADAGDVLAGKVIVGPDGEPLTGTLALSGNASDGQVLSGQTYYNTDAKTKRTGTMPNRGAVNQSLAINGSYTIPAGFHNGSGKVTQSVKTKGAQTYTPGTTNQTIAAGQYLTGAQTIKGDPNLRPENIKKGVSIMGITGSFEGWVSSPLNLFNSGSWGGGQSGYTVVEGLGSYPGNSLSIKNGTIHITTAQSGGDNALLRLNNVGDLTNYKYLKIDSPYNYVWSGVGCGISKKSDITYLEGLDTYYCSPINSSTTSKGTHILDISKFTGTYWIYLYLGTGGNATREAGINKVYLTTN